MDNQITIAIISGLCVAIPTIISTVSTLNKNNALQDERINRIQDDIKTLSQRVEKHNQVAERVSVLEAEVSHLKGQEVVK